MGSYQKLQEILDNHISGAPRSGIFDRILRILFTPEEVKVALGMIFAPRTAAEIAKNAGVPVKEACLRLESLANKGLVFSREKGGEMGYSLLPTIPGVFEFPFMKDGLVPRTDELGRLWEEYHEEALGNSFAGSQTPITRVLPVEEALDPRAEVLHFEKIAEMLEKNDTFALAQCACRVSLKKCDKPLEVCLIFDKTGRFLIERGLAREITRAEALEVVKKAEEAGLVHTTNNSQDRLNLICNCCPCCCTILRGLTRLDNPRAFARSHWQAKIEAKECTGCGICAEERCPVEAIKMVNDVALVDQERCVGCGLCVSACAPEAITMEARPEAGETPANNVELGLKVMGEKGKLEVFVKLMGR